MWHEQSRSDRDDWIRVNWNNVGDYVQFIMQDTLNQVQYNYGSVMHYAALVCPITIHFIDNIRAQRPLTVCIKNLMSASATQGGHSYTPKSQTSYLRNVYCVIMRLLRRYLVLMIAPPLLISGPDDPYGLVKAGNLTVSYRYFTGNLKPNSIALAGSELVRSWFEAKFHYAIWFEPASNQIA